MEKISPRVDIAFKKIFGVEENKDLLISLINSVVAVEDQVSDITLINPYNPKSFLQEKSSILDIKAKDINGRQFNIEIQITDEEYYQKRALYYWAKLYTEQLNAGFGYRKLEKTIGIHILNFITIPETKKYHNIFNIREVESDLQYFDDLELHTIELRKFSKDYNEELPELIAKVKNSLDRWVAFLTRYDLLKNDNLPSELDRPELKKAINVLEVLSFNSEEREAYEGRRKWLMMEDSALSKAEQKGIEKGKAEGREQGIEQGIEQRNIEIARKMLTKNKTIEEIAELTGLTIKQIEELREV